MQVVAEAIAGPWLRHIMLVGGVVCTAALYANCMVISETAMQFFAEEHFAVVVPSQQQGCQLELESQPQSA
jgi:TctA family transporter